MISLLQVQKFHGKTGDTMADKNYLHTAYANSADGTDGFTTVYPNLNLLDGTKDFSGTWTNSSSWVTDGTYKGLTVKKRTAQWNGIYKTFKAPKDGVYTFSAYVKGSGSKASMYRYVSINGGNPNTIVPNKLLGDTFGWLRDSFTVTLKAGDTVYPKYEINASGADSILWTAGHKWEEGSTVTDGLTANYPNLNLLVNSSAKTKDGFFKDFDKVENGYGEVTIKGTNAYVSKNLWDGFSVQPRDYKPNDKYTMSMDVMFTSWNLPAGTHLDEFWIGQRYGNNSWKRICFIDLPKDPSKMLNQWIRITNPSTIPPYENPDVNTEACFLTKFAGPKEGSFTIRVRKPKLESGSVATTWMPSESELQDQLTPWMPSSSEVTTADWPKYVGTYVDTNPVSSTNSSKYDWDEMKYRVYLDGTPIGGSKLLSFDLENLKAGISYNVQVSQINGNVESDKSESVAFKTTLPK